ncbi:MAG TPA: hypothetical protein VFT38_17865 [Vicinamibacteria bacterium]|nr:hypothetical protein [Vicinamibacteria bacterium]
MSRRAFLQATAVGALVGPALAAVTSAPDGQSSPGELATLAARLLETWGRALLRFQVPAPNDPAFVGGLLCPACARIHGRVGDTVYPFLRLARTTGDARFVDAARLVFDWMENVSRDDGSWVNDPSSDWRGTTVFAVIALGEALRRHGDLLPAPDAARLRDRMARAARFLDGFITPTVGNVNYRMSAPLAFALAAEVLGEPHYRERARDCATLVRASVLSSGLVFGEGHPGDRVSPRGCRAVDLGYDVEESLPNLASYAALSGDRELLALVARSLRAHLEFMLPDGGWDNSWGTRNYKWTYWGSRTSDGAGPALLIAAAGEPMFPEAALRNLRLLERCTHDGLLHGGPHLHLSGQRPCLHHTFSHAKALAAMLDHGIPSASGALLPRETAHGVRHYPDIDTWLVARGPWRATITASDWQYVPEGHASGGALSLLWHDRVGLLSCASMTRYQLVEPNNQPLHAQTTMPLTPRLEATVGETVYCSQNDATATVESREGDGGFELVATGVLRNGAQEAGPSATSFRLAYHFTDRMMQIRARIDGGEGGVRLILPVVAASDEPFKVHADGAVLIEKRGGIVHIVSTRALGAVPSERVFNHVPGVQALVLSIEMAQHEEAMMEVTIA